MIEHQFKICLVIYWLLFVATASAEPLRCFGCIDETTTIEVLTKRCGPPLLDIGSGNYVPIWNLLDGSRLTVSSASRDSPIFSARLSKPDGSMEVLYEKKTDEHNKPTEKD